MLGSRVVRGRLAKGKKIRVFGPNSKREDEGEFEKKCWNIVVPLREGQDRCGGVSRGKIPTVGMLRLVRGGREKRSAGITDYSERGRKKRRSSKNGIKQSGSYAGKRITIDRGRRGRFSEGRNQGEDEPIALW